MLGTEAGARWLGRLRLGTRLVGAFMVLTLLLLVSGVVSYRQMVGTDERVSQMLEGAVAERIRVLQLNAAVESQVSSLRGYLLTGDLQRLQRLEQANEEVQALLRQGEDGASTDAAQRWWQRAADSQQRFQATVDEVVQQYRQGRRSEAIQLMAGEGQRLRDALRDLVDQRAQELADATRQAATTLDRQLLGAQRIILGVTLAGLLIAVIVSLTVPPMIAKPVGAVAAVATQVAGGDLTVQHLEVKTADEVGEMASAINRMVERLRQMMQEVAGLARSLLAASEQLSAASEQAAQASGGVSQAVNQVAAGAQEQAQAAEGVRQTMEQLQQAIRQISVGADRTAEEMTQAQAQLRQMVARLEEMARSAAPVEEEATQAANTAQHGAAVVRQATEGMERIREVVDESARRMRDLEQLSSRIGVITDTISGIAEQTNLLALNAAIEAARAGEHGRGFAVVAEEVRKLAERSAASAREITDLIGNIQARTQEAVEAMETGTKEVQVGSQRAREAGTALEEILTVVQRSASAVRSIVAAIVDVRGNAEAVMKAFDAVAAVMEQNRAAAEEMAAGASQVGQSVEQVAAVSQENAAAAEEVSASVEEMNASSEEVARSAEHLAEIARKLEGQVAAFKV